MSSRLVVALLCILLLFLIFVIFNMPTSNNGDQSADPKDSGDEITEANKKVSSGSSQEARFKATIKKFVKSIGDIEARLQVVETKLERFAKEEKKSQSETEEHKEVKEHNDNQGEFLGEIKQGNQCLDSAEHEEGGEVELWECHKLGRNQYFIFKNRMIKHKGLCLSLEAAKQGAKVVIERCHAENFIQKWAYHDGLFQAGESSFCLENKIDRQVTMEQCDKGKKSQKWTYQ